MSASLLGLLVFAWPTANLEPLHPKPPASRAAAASPGGRAQLVVSSIAGDRLRRKPSDGFGPSAPAGDRVLFVVDDGVGLQRIDGFGASFLEAGLVTLNTLPRTEDQDKVLRALFDKSRGAGFSLMKTVIGSTDFQSASPDWYTYDETEGDYDLTGFSISRDLGPAGEVTFIKRARAMGGDFQLVATMDYPPDWMLGSNQDVRPDAYSSLAAYFFEYLHRYEQAGVHVDYLSPFNEPGGYTKITYEEIRDFLRDYLGPAMSTGRSTTRLLLSEDGSRSGAASGYPIVLEDPAARSYLAGLPYHGYDLGNQADITGLQQDYPDLPLWMTEVCCVTNQQTGESFAAGDFWGNQIISELEAGASAWIYWNAILDEEGGPWLVSPIHGDPDGNAQNSVVVIDKTTHQVTYTGLYYYLAHFSKYVRPGAHRIGTNGSTVDGVRAISFQNPDGTIVTELINSGGSAVEAQVDWHGRSLILTLAPTSISTLTWDPQTIK
jgi:glucosylceramidase